MTPSKVQVRDGSCRSFQLWRIRGRKRFRRSRRLASVASRLCRLAAHALPKPRVAPSGRRGFLSVQTRAHCLRRGRCGARSSARNSGQSFRRNDRLKLSGRDADAVERGLSARPSEQPCYHHRQNDEVDDGDGTKRQRSQNLHRGSPWNGAGGAVECSRADTFFRSRQVAPACLYLRCGDRVTQSPSRCRKALT